MSGNHFYYYNLLLDKRKSIIFELSVKSKINDASYQIIHIKLLKDILKYDELEIVIHSKTNSTSLKSRLEQLGLSQFIFSDH